MDDFEKELRQTFLEEAQQLLQDAEECFLSLEQAPNDQKLIEKIFRLAHNLKGSAKGVGFSEVGEFTHDFETLILKIKSGEVETNSSVIEVLLQCNDHLRSMIDALNRDHSAHSDSRDILERVRAAAEGRLGRHDPAPANDSGFEDFSAPTASEAAALLNLEAKAKQELANPFESDDGAMLPALSEQRAKPAAPVASPSNKVEESLRVSLSRLEKLINFVGEMVILQSVLAEQVSGSSSLQLRRTVHQLSKVTKDVQELSMGLRMVPIKPLFQKLQRIIRDVSAQLQKNIEIDLVGEDVEVDKTVLERISDPLVHLVRNSLDHGIEATDQRLTAGKSQKGTISIRAFHLSGRLNIEVADDGGGIDPDKILASAKKKGLVSAGQSFSPRDAQQLIFLSGFSTKAEVTDVSGRGVGMDVVRTNVMELGGDIQIDSEVGKGTTFSISLPLTLAITDGVLVEVGNQRYVLPQTYVHETISVEREQLQEKTGVGTVIMLRGEPIPVVDLGALLRMKGNTTNSADVTAIVAKTREGLVAIVVDRITGQLQVVVKQLGREAQNLRGIAGSTILGDGMPALILEVPELVKAAAQRSTRRAA